jgi:hypothetical protein
MFAFLFVRVGGVCGGEGVHLALRMVCMVW